MHHFLGMKKMHLLLLFYIWLWMSPEVRGAKGGSKKDPPYFTSYEMGVIKNTQSLWGRMVISGHQDFAGILCHQEFFPLRFVSIEWQPNRKWRIFFASERKYALNSEFKSPQTDVNGKSSDAVKKIDFSAGGKSDC